MRMHYETQTDRDREAAFCALMKNKLIKLPISYGVDFARIGAHNEVISFIEFKSRKMKWGVFPTIMLSVLKMRSINELSKLAPCYFVVEADGEYYSCSDFSSLKIEFGGRTTQTRDSADIEPVVLIPIGRFKRLEFK